MYKILILPPITFIILLASVWVFSKLLKKISFKPGEHKTSCGDPYACGEENYDPMAQPDYSNFFPFAFFFTIAHVATLIMATVPMQTIGTFEIAIIYIMSAILGLYILFTK